MSLSADLSCLQSSQGAEREAALASLEKQLMCPICADIFSKPVVILPCQHNLCRKCANELYQPSLFHARTTMLVNSGRFRCPTCRHDVVLDRHGVYGLQRNLLVENIIDIYKQELNQIPSPPPLPPPLPPAEATCSDHEGEKLNIYCLTCQLPTCSFCKVFGAHQNCRVAPLTDVHQQKKDELSEGISSLGEFRDRVQALVSDIEDTCRAVEESYNTQKQNVCDKFSCMFSILEERRKVMTQQISSEEDEKVNHTQMLMRCYGDSMEANRKLLSSVESSMEELDMAAFVQNSKELTSKVIAASSSSPSETLTPGYDSLSLYRFNFSKQEEMLRSIDFDKVVEDICEEPEVNPDPEEPKGPLIQNTEPELCQEPLIPDRHALGEPDEEPLPPPISPPVEPLQLDELGADPDAAAPGPAAGSLESAGEHLQLETDGPGSGDVGPGQVKVERKVERVGAETRQPVREENLRKDQEGMNTQQIVTLVFYLLGLLVILLRFWSYIGCFIYL
ncbi:tripartite motif containing 101 [Xiphophorus hellerii]|uniref:tripartite motif containing 101 n=1 Tax=Xiphophorus hellerii TaxID=8084 RepID=UPI0013B3D476|nr:tripartite motif-containing protein 54-like [Xiphophorus hellerii]XP_032416223.1 tripartite motif-containing protein 54-like [Xiphophorus hellerii]XP_032416232.1 tripartite motif-containing protein 54-like [Xiphophorus hellerii]XP_032416241.1 tripartite motif-containing protein 54-like [Xiphophorus hellerii]